jgi:hypothetical protein
MTHAITLSPDTFAKLQKLAVPLVDTTGSVIARRIEFYERGYAAQPAAARPTMSEARKFNPASPPDLTHTRLLAARLRGQEFVGSALKWNRLLDFALEAAVKETGKPDLVVRSSTVNAIVGQKEDMGYHLLPSAGISVQGQDANGAWRGIFQIAKTLGWSVDVEFIWHEKDGASNPGVVGRFAYGN